jgi:DNA-binding response OmpR family regulator
MPKLTIKEAAQRLRVSELTIRRRLAKGLITGVQEPTPQGYVWMVDLSDDEAEGDHGVTQEIISRMDDTIAILSDQVKVQQEELTAKNKQIEQLHVLLQQAQSALPAPKESQHSWWHKLWHRNGR